MVDYNLPSQDVKPQSCKLIVAQTPNTRSSDLPAIQDFGRRGAGYRTVTQGGSKCYSGVKPRIRYLLT